MFSVVHPIMCDACHKENFTGFRYRCQKCHSYQLCQDCFWRGKVSGTHNNDHETREYSSFVCIIDYCYFFLKLLNLHCFNLRWFLIFIDRNHRANRLVILCERALDAFPKRERTVYRGFQNNPRRHWICRT